MRRRRLCLAEGDRRRRAGAATRRQAQRRMARSAECAAWRGLYFRRVARIDLLTIGEAFEDLVFFDLPRLPEAGEEMKTSRFTATIGGGAVITAIAAARLGLRTAIVSGLQTSAVRR